MRHVLPLALASLLVTLLVLPAASARADAPTEYAARHILVAYKGAERAQATRTKEEAKALAEKALEALRAGADFAQVSHQYSDDKVSDGQGGFLGIFKAGAMTPVFQTAVEGLKEGALSGVVESPFGWHIIQRLSLADAKRIIEPSMATFVGALFTYKGTNDRQAVRAKELALQDATKAAEFLKNGGSFETIPAELGATPLKPGWGAVTVPRGKVLPQFKAIEDAVFPLKYGEWSSPFDTPAGFMVVRRQAWWRMHVQHLLVIYAGNASTNDLQTTRTKEQAKARAEEALKKLEADPKAWAKLVAEYSDEPGAGQRTGDLGDIEAGGKMPPDFELAIASIPSGGHSQVFESRFGYHVVLRVD